MTSDILNVSGKGFFIVRIIPSALGVCQGFFLIAAYFYYFTVLTRDIRWGRRRAMTLTWWAGTPATYQVLKKRSALGRRAWGARKEAPPKTPLDNHSFLASNRYLVVKSSHSTL